MTVATQPDSRLAFAPIITTALLSAGFTIICSTSHSALAATFGGLAVVTLALPALAVASDRLLDTLLVTLAAIVAVTAVWLTLGISWPQWFACTFVLAAYAAALAGLACSLHRIGLNAVVSAAIVVSMALAWLSWPIWLSPFLAGHQTLVDWLVFAHPLLAVNGTLVDQGIWTERPQMYGWTALNQDVTYSIPASVMWCVIVHAAVAVVSAMAVAYLDHRADASRDDSEG
jgi:hypothetical protein